MIKSLMCTPKTALPAIVVNPSARFRLLAKKVMKREARRNNYGL
jgi:hypothetical protein